MEVYIDNRCFKSCIPSSSLFGSQTQTQWLSVWESLVLKGDVSAYLDLLKPLKAKINGSFLQLVVPNNW